MTIMDEMDGATLWRKSSRCEAGACVEVSCEDGLWSVRTTNSPERVATATTEEWSAFILGVKAGEFDTGEAA